MNPHQFHSTNGQPADDETPIGSAEPEVRTIDNPQIYDHDVAPPDTAFVPSPGELARRRRKWLRVSLLLFLATLASTFLAGMSAGEPLGFLRLTAEWLSNPSRVSWSSAIWSGLTYSTAVMGILVFHEMGHWLLARKHGVPATPPFFIPMPISPLGTMGAVIVQGGKNADRRTLFDIAIAGPLAGLVIALPVAWIGISQATSAPMPEVVEFAFGDPPLLKIMYRLAHGPLPAGHDILLNPLLFAGWVGIVITALNLMPVGQLDGGHILYALIGRRAHLVARLLVWGGLISMLYTGSTSYALMLMLLLFFGVKHPPTADDTVPLGRGRIALGWLTLAFLLVGFTPQPFITNDKSKPADPPKPAATSPAAAVDASPQRQQG